jgi:hypothetical protein
MQGMALEGHYTAKVQVDVCTRCHLVWFDALESARLSGLGWVHLIRQMIASPALHAPLAPHLQCVRCHTVLKPVRNLTRFGRSAAQECRNGHGHYQSYSLLLAERGLVRPAFAHDRQALLEQGRHLECLNCGAKIAGQASVCSYCDSPVVMVDVPRLTQALLVRHGDVLELKAPAQQLGVACIGCGHALDPTVDIRCNHCDQSVALPQLHLLTPLLDNIEPILQGRAPRQAKPWGTRLRELQNDPTQTQFYRLLQHLRGPRYLDGEYNPREIVVWVVFALLMIWLAR